jgi:hypothetical protein
MAFGIKIAKACYPVLCNQELVRHFMDMYNCSGAPLLRTFSEEESPNEDPWQFESQL